jgi:hypothetical protein
VGEAIAAIRRNPPQSPGRVLATICRLFAVQLFFAQGGQKAVDLTVSEQNRMFALSSPKKIVFVGGRMQNLAGS